MRWPLSIYNFSCIGAAGMSGKDDRVHIRVHVQVHEAGTTPGIRNPLGLERGDRGVQTAEDCYIIHKG